MSKPNLLFLFTDQQRADAMGCAGGWVETPHLDRIADEGVRVTNCVPNSPVCVPARYCLATGLYPHNTGVWNNCHHTMPPESRTWMQAIRDAGYRTALFGKTHWHPHQGDLRDRAHLLRAYGLDDFVEVTGPRASARTRSDMTDAWEQAGLWKAFQDDYAERFSNKPNVVRPSPLGAELYYDAFVGQQACEYLRSYDRDQPWFCWVSFPGPHEPWDTPEPYASRYDPADMPPPRKAPASPHRRPLGQLDRKLERAPKWLEPDDPPKMRADYAGNISLIDDQIGRILQVIEQRGELDNTVIVFSSDHGEMNGDAGLTYKSQMLDGAVRVPLLLRTPAGARRGGAVSEALVEANDIGPTLAAFAGVELEHQQFGRSFAGLAEDPHTPHRAEAISEIDGEVMLLDHQWKAVANAEGEIYLLFDVQNDPEESTNRAGDPALKDLEADLRQRMFERLVRTQLRHDRQT